MSVAAMRLKVAIWIAFWRHVWIEWRALILGVFIAGLLISTYYLHQWTQWSRELLRVTRQQAAENRELMSDLRTIRSELRIAQTQNDLLTTRRLIALARRALETQKVDEAQTYLAQAASYVRAVNPLVIDVNPSRLDRLKNELMLADLRRERTAEVADRRLTELAGEVDALIGE